MEKLYIFKVALKHRKGLWRTIAIKGSQTLADFDEIIRTAFNYDTSDHLSEFFIGQWSEGGFGEINPDGGGSGADKRIGEIAPLQEGGKLGYIYDFGDMIENIITLEKIGEIEKEIEYPCIILKNKPRYHYCEMCNKKGKKNSCKLDLRKLLRKERKKCIFM